MRRAEKVIISTAITGSVNVPSQSEYLPLGPEQVVQASLEAVAAGSAIIHLHARHPDGRPAFEPEVFELGVPVFRVAQHGFDELRLFGHRRQGHAVEA